MRITMMVYQSTQWHAHLKRHIGISPRGPWQCQYH